MQYWKIIFDIFSLKVTGAEEYLEKFNFVMAQYFQGVSGVVAIFNYMVS